MYLPSERTSDKFLAPRPYNLRLPALLIFFSPFCFIILKKLLISSENNYIIWRKFEFDWELWLNLCWEVINLYRDHNGSDSNNNSYILDFRWSRICTNVSENINDKQHFIKFDLQINILRSFAFLIQYKWIMSFC